MEAQNGIFVGKHRLVDRHGSMYYTNRDVNKRMDQVGSKGKENNMIVSLRFSIIECFRRSYNKGFMG